jgi:HPt (histidine-containing phosphotransfer) domain-containing protein
MDKTSKDKSTEPKGLIDISRSWNIEQVKQCRQILSSEDYDLIVNKFFMDFSNIQILINAIELREKDAILIECHKLKGAAQLIGFIGMAKIILEIEKLIKEYINIDPIDFTKKLNTEWVQGQASFKKLTKY